MVARKIFSLKGKKVGVSLIEVILAVVIISFLAMVSIISLNPRAKIGQSLDARRKADLKNIQIAFEDYYVDHHCYPTPPLVCGTDFRPYLDKIPCDPEGGNYAYFPPAVPDACPQFFCIYTNLSSQSDPDVVKIGCESGCGPPEKPTYNYGAASSNVSLEKAEIPTEPTSLPSSPSSTPKPTTIPGQMGYGCFSGVCLPISGAICSPNYFREDCYNNCGTPGEPRNECL